MINNEKNNLIDLLNYINPSILDYTQWVSVGMALKNAGATANDWDSWSQKDTARYHSGDCDKKWDSFRGASKPVTIGTIVNMAKDQGWEPPKKIEHCELEWDSTISYEQGGNVIIDSNWVEDKEVKQPITWEPVQELIQYLSILFESDDKIGYVTETWKKDDRYLPGKGAYDRTAGQLVKELKMCRGDIGQVIGDYKEAAGAWIRFNPLDGQGVKNANVTDFKYALIESDDMPIRISPTRPFGIIAPPEGSKLLQLIYQDDAF